MNSNIVIKNDLDLSKVGQVFQKSGLFKDIKDQAQAVVKIMAGQEMGFGPVTSMVGIHVVQGKPMVSANLMAAALKAHPRYDYRLRELTDKKCTIEFFQREEGGKESLGEWSWTMEDAKLAGLLSNPTWKKYPRDMLFSRCMSSGIKKHTPDVFYGITTYVPGEVGELEEAITIAPEEAYQVIEEATGHPVDRDEETRNEQVEAVPEDESTFWRYLKAAGQLKAQLGPRVYYAVLSRKGLKRYNGIEESKRSQPEGIRLMNEVIKDLKAVGSMYSDSWWRISIASLFQEYTAKSSRSTYDQIVTKHGLPPQAIDGSPTPSDAEQEALLGELEDGLLADQGA